MKSTYGWTKQFLTKDGKPILPVMGEFHFSRYPHRYWREELEKMKAGGVEIVSTYIFWNHHEDIHGNIHWDGDRDIHSFLKCCGEVGLLAFLRPGPWCHGEARHGGFPDRLIESDMHLRSNDPAYLGEVRRFWSSLFEQTESDLFKNGGPVIGIQIENEYSKGGSGCGDEHIRTLTKIAKEIGFDVPLWTATGWSSYIGDLLPVSGGYVEEPWHSSIGELPANDCFIFADKEHLPNIGKYLFDASLFPFLTAELGGGLQVTYNRRPRVSAADIGAASLIRLGSGANLLGYYVFHGGTNPVGEKYTLQESKSVGNSCDLPAFSYDFQAPIREFGSIAESFREIRMLSMFLKDFGETLAPMDAVIPEDSPRDPEDTESLRTAVRTDEKRGFIFINNYQRRRNMKKHENVCLRAGDVSFEPIDILPGEYFFLPFHMMLGETELISAAATPLCRLRDGFVFYADRDARYRWNGKSAKVLTLSRKDAKNAVKVKFDDEYLIICKQPVIETSDGVYCLARKDVELKIFPNLPDSGAEFENEPSRCTLPLPESAIKLTVNPLMKVSDIYREYELLLDGTITGDDVFLTVDYEGDQAELIVDGIKAADDYYRGDCWEIGLKRWDFPRKMLLRIFAMTQGAPVFTDEPLNFENGRALRLNGVTAKEEFRIQISPDILSGSDKI
ncbi:MAG: beta-galactosidase [Clostridia bacterium]|nr:beta-galactosidase [Clostridia bacterium]